MGRNACVIAFLLMSCVAAVTCAKKGCDALCTLRSLGSTAGKRTKSVDLNQASYPWKQGDTPPTYTADVMTKVQKSTCVFDEALKRISPKWQERLLSVLEGALVESKEKEDDRGSFVL